MRNAVIHSSGMYVPDRIIKNEYFDKLLGENVSDWLKDYVKIYERRWCSENQSTADLAIEAGKAALNNGNVSPDEIDLLIIATDTPEYISPSTSSKVQYLLGLKNAGTFDINTACAGFVTALDTASKYIIADKSYNTVMIIGAYAMSKYLNMMDKKTVNLFADGAGCMILKSSEKGESGFLASKLITKGEYHDFMGIYAGGTNTVISEEVIREKKHLLTIAKRFPSELNPQTWSEIVKDLVKKASINLEDVKLFLFTQININSIWDTMDMLNLPRERAQTSMHYYGYTGSACIPISFEDALKQKKIERGDIIFMIGSGGGFSVAGAAFKY
ncbi:MAG: ketoacyl-ACP synthase III [Ignavibacteriales bacterium]|nr:ketoacyl-ACP synthase III [Ignavibacteriales bacterium]